VQACPERESAVYRAAAEDDGELVVAGGQAAPLLDLLVGPFDDVAVLVLLGVVADRAAAGRSATQPVLLLVGPFGDDRLDPALT